MSEPCWDNSIIMAESPSHSVLVALYCFKIPNNAESSIHLIRSVQRDYILKREDLTSFESSCLKSKDRVKS
jgi:hypothetical protein